MLVSTYKIYMSAILHTFIYTCMHVCMFAYMCVCMYVFMQICVHMDFFEDTRIFALSYMFQYVSADRFGPSVARHVRHRVMTRNLDRHVTTRACLDANALEKNPSCTTAHVSYLRPVLQNVRQTCLLVCFDHC